MQTTINSQVALALDRAKTQLLQEQQLEIVSLQKEIDELRSNIDSMHDLHIELENNAKKKQKEIDFMVKNLKELEHHLEVGQRCYDTGYCLGLVQNILLNLKSKVQV